MSEPDLRFAAVQARTGPGGIITALDQCRWVSHPVAMARAEYKPVQRAAARSVGLRIAPTLISNQPEAVKAFAAQMDGPIVCKPVASPVFIEGDQLKAVYSRRLTDEDLADLRGPGLTKHLFQAWADKAYEVRLTVVGNRMFATEIHAGSEAARTRRCGPARRVWEEWAEWTRETTYRVTDIPGVGHVETWAELTDVSLPLVSFRGTHVFASDGDVLTSESTLRFRERAEIERDLHEHGFVVEDVRDAPDRPGREFVFVARRATAEPVPPGMS
ncbi:MULTISPECIES: hypothetical protein [unclassified Streptomyces]|uniref:hypothetical protein n=1 Tax=unclassified Streptomyces TaxID=2593676 RepID=UPI0034408088